MIAVAALGLVGGVGARGPVLLSLQVPEVAPAVISTYQAPVQGEPSIVEPFRAPTTRFGAGNRAVELAVAERVPVLAPNSGTIGFAGPLFGGLAISIDHPDGLRSTLTQLASIKVGTGDVVETGQPIGIAAGIVAISLRAGGAYIDPTLFWKTSQ